jgi:hypothetical protein
MTRKLNVRFGSLTDIRCQLRHFGNVTVVEIAATTHRQHRTLALNAVYSCCSARAKLCCTNCFSVPVAGIEYVEHTEGDGGEMFQAVCKTWFEGTKSKSPSLQ